MNTNALNRLIKEKGENGVMVCAECGSLDIQYQAWVDANYKTYGGDIDDDDIDTQWCEECQMHVRFKTLADFEKMMDNDIANLPSKDPRNRSIKKEWAKLPYLRKRETWVVLFGEEVHSEKKNTIPNIASIRANAIDRIKSLMLRCKFSELSACDVEEGCSPVVQEDAYDDNMTYTLDSICLDDDGKLSFNASSCANNIFLTEDNISTDVLLNIASWLNNNEQEIIENFLREGVEDIDIDDIEDILNEKGATGISYCDESIDDGIDIGEDKYLMLRSYDFVFGKYEIHGKFYFGDCSRTISCVELDINDNE